VTARVLLIDDDSDTALLVKLVLRSRQLVIHHAINGSEGLLMAAELHPDLIILDVMMPGMDGYEVCTRLRQFTDVPIMMCTVKTYTSDVDHGLAVGADRFVKKPFRNEELLNHVDYLLPKM